MKPNYIYILLLGCIFCFTACAKEDDLNSKVPYVKVEIDISTIIEHQFNNSFYAKKYYPNQNGVVYGGYLGTLAISNEDASWIFAYDLCCPYEAPLKNEIQMNGSFKAKCPKCGSTYNLMNGGRVESGPGTEKLKNYLVRKDGSFYRIRN